MAVILHEVPVHKYTASHALSDLGNAQRLRERYHGYIRYVSPWGQWIVWDGKIWRPDDTGQITRYAAEAIHHAAETEPGLLAQELIPSNDESEDEFEARKSKEIGRLLAWLKQSESLRSLRAMTTLAGEGPRMSVDTEELDSQPLYMSVRNGTLDLSTGELMPHSSEHYITQLVNLDYNPKAECPLFMQFLSEVIPDELPPDKAIDKNGDMLLYGDEGETSWDGPAVREYIQRVAGYGATGRVREQALFVLYGNGANGKSTLLDAISYVLGDLAKHADTETIFYRNGNRHPEDLARLKGARFVTSVEVERGRKLSEAIVKQATGGDPIVARFMRGNSFEYVPQFTILLAVNDLPEVRGSDWGIWRRLRPIPFPRQFAEAEMDKELPQKLQAEAQGILAWIVEGAKRWHADGLTFPMIITDVTHRWRLGNNWAEPFREEVVISQTDGFVPSAMLRKAAEIWLLDNGMDVDEAKAAKFTNTMSRLGLKASRKYVLKRQQRGYAGIAFQPDWAARMSVIGS